MNEVERRHKWRRITPYSIPKQHVFVENKYLDHPVYNNKTQ